MKLLQELMTMSGDVNLSQVKWPEREIEEGQTVVGTASDDAKRLWGVLSLMMDEFEKLARQHNKICNGDHRRLPENKREEHDALMSQLKALQIKLDLTRDIFWVTLRLEHPELLSKSCIGIGQNGQVYHEKSRPRAMGIDIISVNLDDLPPGLNHLFD